MNPWRGRRVLVTGAAGFIGANLVDALASAGADVHALVRASTDCWRLDARPAACARVVADLTDRRSVKSVLDAVRPQVIFHLAARGGHFESPAEIDHAMTTTQQAIENICQAAAEIGPQRVVHFGSSLEYGPSTEPLRETRELAPTTGRGVVKAAEARWALAFARRSGLPLVVLRPFSVYGPWEPSTRFVPTVMRALLDDEALRLTPPGVRRDFIFVKDVVDAALTAALTPGASGEVFNVGTGRQTTNEELVAVAAQMSGRQVRTQPGAFPLRSVDTGHWVADITKTRERLGWSATHDVRSGLTETHRWCAARRTPLMDSLGGAR